MRSIATIRRKGGRLGGRSSAEAASRMYETGGVKAVSHSGYGICSESMNVRILLAHVVVLHTQLVTYLVEQAR